MSMPKIPSFPIWVTLASVLMLRGPVPPSSSYVTTSEGTECVSDTSLLPSARGHVVTALSRADFSAQGLPHKPDPGTITVATDSTTCTAALTAYLSSFGQPHPADSILVLRIGSNGYAVFETPSTGEASYWSSSWSYLFTLLEI